MSYEFGGLLIDSYEKYLHAICESWMYGDGWNNKEMVKDAFERNSLTEIVDELISEWFQDGLEEKGIAYDDLISAMSDVKESIFSQ
jgi:hypothetical protein